MALPALLLAILITIIAFTAGSGTHCTRAVALHGVAGRGGRVLPERRRGAAADEPLRGGGRLAADPGCPR